MTKKELISIDYPYTPNMSSKNFQEKIFSYLEKLNTNTYGPN